MLLPSDSPSYNSLTIFNDYYINLIASGKHSYKSADISNDYYISLLTLDNPN